ncbi:putative A/G-specific adenine glycosylase YfhQ [Paraliobacillus sp. PM-2]|uniref:A/G-specific adenine glycosylase n=1 Tax=Paraliobacillus sp. PM-2 TaxID=1462524 RepID=UPI00061BC1F9|nr:A/G-specific adenine glycosylase [Paraliobacillus sp. PM-2]CQR47210.1 putative A/G-specific adenine glycosylase YfhQ [Paraliobacillus sp. PM-2]
MKDSNLTKKLQKIDKDTFQEDLINWFHNQKRILPWREDQDPYKVWVSEIMLQQTKVDTVIPYFNHFIEKFPSVEALANADEQEVLKAWEGLGYYSRARNLQQAVREVSTTYNGIIPNDPKRLSELKGVGPYTTGAILSIAYDIPQPAVDGNVMRVLSRILMIDDDIAKARTRRIFEEAVRDLISDKDPSGFNQGLMELGALVCTPKSPSCLLCPVQTHCQAFHNGVEQAYPVKSKAKKQKKLSYYTCVLQDEKGRFFIEQRPNEGLLANMWQFPMVLKQDVDEEHLATWVEQKYHLTIHKQETLPKIKHVFSHVIWELDVRFFRVENAKGSINDQLFLSLDALTTYPFPVPFQKLMDYLKKHSR